MNIFDKVKEIATHLDTVVEAAKDLPDTSTLGTPSVYANGIRPVVHFNTRDAGTAIEFCRRCAHLGWERIYKERTQVITAECQSVVIEIEAPHNERFASKLFQESVAA